MKLVIDGDGCPVVKETIEIGNKYKLDCIIFCDTSHQITREGAKTIVVDKGADSVDFALVNHLSSGDIVITQDFGLAAMCLGRNAFAIRQDGLVYDETNIDSLLFARHLSKKIRNSGGRLKGSGKRDKKENETFKQSLEAVVQNHLSQTEQEREHT